MVANLIHTKVICKCNDMILIGSDKSEHIFHESLLIPIKLFFLFIFFDNWNWDLKLQQISLFI